jgi:hypothetical protein
MSNFLNMCTYLENTLIIISNARFTVNKHAFFLLVGGVGGREGIGNVNGSMFAHCLTVLLFAFADSLNIINMGYSCGLQCPLPWCRSSFIDSYTISCSQF